MRPNPLDKFKELMEDPHGNHHFLVNMYRHQLQKVRTLEGQVHELLMKEDRLFQNSDG